MLLMPDIAMRESTYYILHRYDMLCSEKKTISHLWGVNMSYVNVMFVSFFNLEVGGDLVCQCCFGLL